MCFVCIQETKCEKVSKERGYQLWGSSDIGWIENSVVNNGGSLLTMWKKECI